MHKFLYKHRFEVFLITQIAVLFGSLFFPLEFYEEYMLPLFFLINIMAGILMLSKVKKVMWFNIGLLLIALAFFGGDMFSRRAVTTNYGQGFIQLTIYSLFYMSVSWNIIKQVWAEHRVDKKVILGLISGYISLGFLAFFLFMFIELWTPGSFAGMLLDTESAFNLRSDSLMYYAYITLLTIGYGEIIPTNPPAQKAAILVGLAGQFYIAIITAVVVEKYIRYTTKSNE